MSHPQAIPDRILAWVAIKSHHQPPAILVPELECDIPDIETAFDEHRRARVPQLV
jgi:hypothetical protein